MKLKIALFALLTALATPNVMAAATCPAELDKTACVYFKEGYAAGADDAKAKLDKSVQRHQDSYDSRYENAFSKGYEQGFKEGK
jgi:flagellar biosynthesis/type III secretory pathway protein FliH